MEHWTLNNLDKVPQQKSNTSGRVWSDLQRTDYISLYNVEQYENNPHLIDFIKRLSIDNSITINVIKPGGSMIPHLDGKRGCGILTSIYPHENYAPTTFWSDKWGSKLICKAEYTGITSILVNTNTYHGIVNDTQEWRINFQVNLYEPYHVVKTKIFTEGETSPENIFKQLKG